MSAHAASDVSLITSGERTCAALGTRAGRALGHQVHAGQHAQAAGQGRQRDRLGHRGDGRMAFRGKYVIVECRGDTENEAAMGVGEAIEMLQKWIPEQGYAQGDACFACSAPRVDPPPYIEYVYIKIEKQPA